MRFEGLPRKSLHNNSCKENPIKIAVRARYSTINPMNIYMANFCLHSGFARMISIDGKIMYKSQISFGPHRL